MEVPPPPELEVRDVKDFKEKFVLLDTNILLETLNKHSSNHTESSQLVGNLAKYGARLGISYYSLFELAVLLLIWNKVPFSVNPPALKTILKQIAKAYTVAGVKLYDTFNTWLTLMENTLPVVSTGAFRKFDNRSDASLLDDLWILASVRTAVADPKEIIHVVSRNAKDMTRGDPTQFCVWKPKSTESLEKAW